jgi:Flp pilus assembly protein TadB
MQLPHAEAPHDSRLKMLTARSARERLTRLLAVQEDSQPVKQPGQEPPAWPLLRRAGITRARQRCYAAIALVSVLLSLVQLSLNMRLTALLTLIPALLIVLVVLRRATQRALAFERDFSAMILSLTSMVRAGKDPLVALRDQSEQWSSASVLGQELAQMAAALDAGISPRQVLEGFAKDIAYPDVALFRGAVCLSVEEGASLCPILERLAKVLRQRQSFRRKLRAALAMQRVSAFGIVGCAICVGLMQAVTQGERLWIVLQHPWGSTIISSGVSVMLIGLVWMLLMSRQRV